MEIFLKYNDNERILYSETLSKGFYLDKKGNIQSEHIKKNDLKHYKEFNYSLLEDEEILTLYIKFQQYCKKTNNQNIGKMLTKERLSQKDLFTVDVPIFRFEENEEEVQYIVQNQDDKYYSLTKSMAEINEVFTRLSGINSDKAGNRVKELLVRGEYYRGKLHFKNYVFSNGEYWQVNSNDSDLNLVKRLDVDLSIEEVNAENYTEKIKNTVLYELFCNNTETKQEAYKKTELIIAYLSYCFQSGNPFKKALWLIGGSDSGKTLILTMFNRIFGKYCVNDSFESFNEKM
ncbi:MAG: hypothetical protein LBU40_02070, partial [Methanobrevibacter sp.]|nr:hypothetical protein [Methanobrevibacter sp.]